MFLEKEGFACFYFAGELDRPDECSYLAKTAHFKHPDIKEINDNCFWHYYQESVYHRKDLYN